MQITYSELDTKLKELDLVIKAYETLISAGRVKNEKYISKPILCLKNEMNEIKDKIEQLKSNIIFNYDGDIAYFDNLISVDDYRKGREKISTE